MAGGKDDAFQIPPVVPGVIDHFFALRNTPDNMFAIPCVETVYSLAPSNYTIFGVLNPEAVPVEMTDDEFREWRDVWCAFWEWNRRIEKRLSQEPK